LKDFDAVGLVGDLPFVLVCNAALPVHNLKELIQYAKANPDKFNNASSGNGTASHLAMEEIKRKAGLKITHIPYKRQRRRVDRCDRWKCVDGFGNSVNCSTPC
jgi:tripartite-type tricarboxylate transporter receptor subunit TctC